MAGDEGPNLASLFHVVACTSRGCASALVELSDHLVTRVSDARDFKGNPNCRNDLNYHFAVLLPLPPFVHCS